MKAGSTTTDQAVIINSGQEALALRLYAADGITAINGSTAFAAADEQRTGVHSWLSTEVSDVQVAPGDRATVLGRHPGPGAAGRLRDRSATATRS